MPFTHHSLMHGQNYAGQDVTGWLAQEKLDGRTTHHRNHSSNRMRCLIACEYSGVVRDAFAARGWKAWSCDLLPTESTGNHYQGDVRDMLGRNWDLVIAHPPCTYLTVSANKWMKDQPPRKSGTLVGQARREAADEAAAFFMLFASCDCPHLAIENPIGAMSTRYRKPDQVIQPWQYGHAETKATCLWLKNLPKLTPTNIVEGREQRLHRLPPSHDRAKIRSKTYSGIAAAMAEQWTAFLKTQ